MSDTATAASAAPSTPSANTPATSAEAADASNAEAGEASAEAESAEGAEAEASSEDEGEGKEGEKKDKKEAKADKAEAKKLEKEIKKELKKYKLKIDGADEELTEDELIKHAQLGKAAHKRMQESAQLRKDVEEFVKLLKTNPAKVLSDPNIGVDIKKFAQDVMNQELEDMQKSPEQREKEKLQKELEELKEKYKKDEEDRKKSEFERLQAQAEQQLENDITTALDDSGLPKSPYVVKKMADYMIMALQNGIDLNAKDVLPLVQKNIQDEIREMFSASAEDVLEELVGKDNLSRLRKYNLAKVKPPVAAAKDIKPTGADVKPKTPEAPKKVSMKDFLKS